MTPKRLSAKFFLDPEGGVDPSAVVPVFHDWISRQLVGEVLIDVADYSHVQDGPAIMLVALEADYVLDFADGKPGIRYIRKRNVPDTLPAALAQVIANAAHAAHLLQNAGFAPDASGVEVEIFDKLHYPQDTASFNVLAAELENVGRVAWADGVSTARVPVDPRRPLRLVVGGKAPATFEQLVTRLRNSQYLQNLYAETLEG